MRTILVGRGLDLLLVGHRLNVLFVRYRLKVLGARKADTDVGPDQ